MFQLKPYRLFLLLFILNFCISCGGSGGSGEVRQLDIWDNDTVQTFHLEESFRVVLPVDSYLKDYVWRVRSIDQSILTEESSQLIEPASEYQDAKAEYEFLFSADGIGQNGLEIVYVPADDEGKVPILKFYIMVVIPN